jgi:hypothetical protein
MAAASEGTALRYPKIKRAGLKTGPYVFYFAAPQGRTTVRPYFAARATSRRWRAWWMKASMRVRVVADSRPS